MVRYAGGQQNFQPRMPDHTAVLEPTAPPTRFPPVGWMRTEVTQFIRFLKHPRRGHKPRPQGFSWVGRTLFFSVLVQLAFNVPSLLLTDGLQEWAKLPMMWELPDSLVKALMLCVVLPPLLEEIVFRAGMRSPTASLFVTPLLVLLMLAALEPAVVAVPTVLVITMCGVGHAVLMRRDPLACWRFGRHFVRHYGRVFWMICTLFAFVHVTNYQLGNSSRDLVVPLLVLPQFLSGMAMGYLRLRDGLRASLLLHALNNFYVVGLVLLVSST